jgi:RNA polymerase sigma-70 factor (sigma-E family)
MDRYDGFREFVLARRSALSRTAYLLTGDHAVAEDLLQTALVRTAEHWHRIVGGDPEAYLRRVMVNERTSRWRRRRYAVEVPTSTEALAAASGPGWPSATAVPDAADAVVRRATLVAALAQLPPRQRAVVVLRFFDDLSEAQTAEVLGCAIGTVKSQAHVALARLRSLAPILLSDQEVST